MANDIKVMSALDKEIIRQFNVKSIVGNTFNRQYDKTYQAFGTKAGSTIQIKQIQRYVVSTGATLVKQDHIERVINLPRTTQKHVGLAFTSQELTQDLTTVEGMAMFSQENLETAMDTLCADIVFHSDWQPAECCFAAGFGEVCHPAMVCCLIESPLPRYGDVSFYLLLNSINPPVYCMNKVRNRDFFPCK